MGRPPPLRPMVGRIRPNQGVIADGKGLLQHRVRTDRRGGLENCPRFQQLSRSGSAAPAKARIEDGKTGDTVGAVRNVLYQERPVRQRYWRCPTSNDRKATNSAVRTVAADRRLSRRPYASRRSSDGDRAFVEWWATFDCEPVRREELIATLRGWFAKWLESLRRTALAEAFPDDRGADTLSRHRRMFRADLGHNLPDIGRFGRIRPLMGCCINGRIWHSSARCRRIDRRQPFGRGCSSVVEHDLAKVGVEGSSPFARSKIFKKIRRR